MQGDDRSRFCIHSNLHVYNFAQMSQREIEQLLAEKEGRICARMYQRSDGTLLTQDCPVGFRVRVQRAGRMVVSALSAAMSLCVAAAQTPVPEQSSRSVQAAKSAATIVVLDPLGAVIPAAKISLKHTSGEVAYEGETDAEGEWKANAIVPGAYTLKISSPGFAANESELTIASPTASIRRVLRVAPTMGAIVIVMDPPAEVTPSLIQIDPIPLVRPPAPKGR